MAVTLDNGNIVNGKMDAEEDKIYVQTGEEKKIALEKKQIKAVRAAKKQEEYEIEQKRLSERKLTDFWSGTVDAEFSVTAGNSDTRTFSAGFRGVRETPNNKFTAYVNALQVQNWTSGTKKTTAQTIWAGFRHDADVNKKWFGFTSGDFEYNKPQKLNVRAVLGGAAGYHAIRQDRINLDFTFGATNNYENFSNGVRRNSAELLLGEEAKIKINSRVRLTNRLVFYPNVSRFGNFRALFDGSLQTDINSWLGWHLTVGNR